MKKTAKEIFQIVKQQHRKRTDFIEGNISKRIYATPLYELKRVPLNLIDEQEWDIDEDLVIAYAKKESKKRPPVILHYEDGLYSIVDGIHRVNAAKALKEKYINAYVGILPLDIDVDAIIEDDDDEDEENEQD